MIKTIDLRPKKRFKIAQAPLMFGAFAALPFVFSLISFPALAESKNFENPYFSPESRVADLISRMSPLEKISQLGNSSPALPQFNIKAYNYGNEAIHGIAAEGVTVFPQVIGLSSTWDTLLLYKIASTISDEARALNSKNGKGLTYWSPTANMLRDPRWGRSEETYGEDVYLAKKFIVNFVNGMQGFDPTYLKTIATVKHFACNNVENNREGISSNVDERSLREYYLPVFKAAITEAHAGSVMSAYNALNGIPCTANYDLLTSILRKEWHFSGYVVSDCDAIEYVCKAHHYVSSFPEATVAAIKAGCDLCCGLTYQQYLPLALAGRLRSINQADIDTALTRILLARIRLGEFDPAAIVPYTSIAPSNINSVDHQNLALQAARESIVLLKNTDTILPLNAVEIKTVAVIGPNANACRFGGYNGNPVSSVSALKGIQTRLGDSTGLRVSYALGCSISGPKNSAEFDKAVALASVASAAIMVMGTDNNYIGEGHDLDSLGLPGVQSELIKAVYKANPKTIVVLVNGNPLSIPWIQENIPGIVEAWYNGQSQGSALAEVLFGDYNPGGKLTSTWVSSVADLPDMRDYSIFNNRTYQYFTGKPLYPFGFGLSYTSFLLGNFQIYPKNIGPGTVAMVSVDVANTGARTGDDVVQFYIHDRGLSVKKPLKQLKGFNRIALKPGEVKTIKFLLPYEELSFWDSTAHSFKVEGGSFDVFVGHSSTDLPLSGEIIASSSPHEMKKFSPAPPTASAHIEQNRFLFTWSGSGQHQAKVYSTNGRVIFSYENAGAGSFLWRAPCPGVYVVTLKGTDYQHTEKLITSR